MFLFLFLFFSMLLLWSFFRLKELFQVKNGLTKQRNYAREELQRTISIENKHTLYCFMNCGLLHLSTQTFPKNIIVNHLINGENRRKSKRLPAMTWLDKIGHVDRVQHRRLQDSGEKSFSNKKCGKRAPPLPFPSRARLIFALLV